MADSVVSLAIERIADLLIHEATSLNDVKEEVESLKAELVRMLSFLKDVDRKKDQDERLRTRVGEIREVVYDAEDVIDSYILQVAHRGGFHGIIKRFKTTFTKPFHLHKIGKQVKAIQTKLENISKSLQAYGISGERDHGSSSVAEMQHRLRRSYPHVEEEDVVSLEVSTKDVLDRLIKKDDHGRLQIVSVAGMGGIGKTTLAKKVYNHNEIKRYFDYCDWVFISQQFMPRDVLHGILINVLSPSKDERERIDKLKEHELVVELSNVLKDKRYLVVLDDIWRCEQWDILKPAFPKGDKGSKLLFTTRNKKVALHADPRSPPIQLPFLTNDESWQLFKRKAFPKDETDSQACLNEFEMLGKEMLKKCGGLPLAIVVLGGLLATKWSLDEWEMVQKSINVPLNKLQQQDYQYGEVNAILALSYNELPFHLKPCFLYLGHYPEDSEILKKELIRLWIAEGFISSSLEGGEMLMEDVAEQYLGELTNRSLVQVGRRDQTGRGIKTYRIHDLLRDLCVSKAEEENFFGIVVPPLRNRNENHSLDLTEVASKVRRIAVYPSNRHVSLRGECKKLRSLLLFQDEEWIRLHISKCSNFRFLRVLKLLREDSTKYSWHMPSEIGNLFHLRYLALKSDSDVFLPQSIGYMKSLHTLDFEVMKLQGIDIVLYKLENLRHLKIKLLYESFPLIFGCVIKGCHHQVKSFESLQTLKYVAVNNLTKSSGLQSLRTQLYGHDTFPNLEPLSQCHHLSKLYLKTEIREDPKLSHHVLEFLPKNIAKLTLLCSRIKQDPMVVLEKLPYLKILNLCSSAYEGTKLCCSANGFPQLDFLYIEMPNVEEWEIEEGAMPRLRILTLESVDKLRMIPEGLKHITTLQELTLKYAKKSLVKKIEVKDGIEGKDFYKVSHIPTIKIYNTEDD